MFNQWNRMMIFSNIVNKFKTNPKSTLIFFIIFGSAILYKSCRGEAKTYYRAGEVKGVKSCSQLNLNSYLCGLDIYDTSTNQLLSNETVGLQSQAYVGDILFSECTARGSSVSCSDRWGDINL